MNRIPKDPVILLSYVNTQLRDNYQSLDEMCQALGVDPHGIISALQVLAALRRHKTTLPAFISELKLFPQTLVNVRIRPGFNWKENVALQAEKQAVDQILGNNGRVLIRPSGTEPLLRIMVETADPAEAQSLAERIAAVCRAEAA